MESVYEQLNSPPSQPVYWLIQVRAAMPYWVPGIPLLLGLMWFMLLAGYWSMPRWLLGRGQSSKYLGSALVAHNLAVQVEQTHSDRAGAKADVAVEDYSLAQSPMMRWALSTSSGGESAASSPHVMVDNGQQARRLRLTANLYDTMQTIHAQRLRVGLTLFACIVLGGGMTLVYALALFGPLVQLLNDIVGR